MQLESLKVRLDMKALAQLGARTRLIAIEAERAEIYSVFPALKANAFKAGWGANGAAKVPQPKAIAKHPIRRRRRKPHWASTPEGRKVVSRRLKKYWAAKRAEKRALEGGG